MTILDILASGGHLRFEGAPSHEVTRSPLKSYPLAEAPVPGGCILAVDIGAHSAAALLDKGPACRPEISPHLLATIVRHWSPSRAWVEHIGPRAGDRPAGVFAFGGSRATVEAVLACLAMPFRTITLATWKCAANIPAEKEMKGLALSRAGERWPAHAERFTRVCDHDRAEAALIGWAGLQRERAG